MQQPCTPALAPCTMRYAKRHSACVVVIDLGFPGHFPHFGGHDEEATVMRGLILGLIWLAAGAAQADVYISIDAKGGYVLTNVHRPGRHYEKVINEPLAQAGPANAQMITGRPYAEVVATAARIHNVPPALLHALIKAESGYNPKARSSAGAVGLMQLMPDTAREMGVEDRLDPEDNVQGGARYLKQMLTLFNNDITLAVAAYNAGPDAVMRRGAVPPFAETRRYVPTVLREYRKLQGLANDSPL